VKEYLLNKIAEQVVKNKDEDFILTNIEVGNDYKDILENYEGIAVIFNSELKDNEHRLTFKHKTICK